jgi:hypothetical protein
LTGVDFYHNGYFIVENAVAHVLIDEARHYINSHYNQWLAHSKRQDDWRLFFCLEFADLYSVSSIGTNLNYTDLKSMDVSENGNISYRPLLSVEHPQLLSLLLRSPKIIGKLHSLLDSRLKGNQLLIIEMEVFEPLISNCS